MKVLFFLVALFGLGCALQSKIQYKYEYSGRVATAIPDLKSEASVAGIKCDVIVNMDSPSRATVQFSNFQVGTEIKEVPFELRGKVPLSYSAIQNTPEILEPFTISMKSREGETLLDVPQTESTWVSNVRKSILQPLRLSLRADEGSLDMVNNRAIAPGELKSKSFARYEDTLFGNCEVRYVLSRLPSDQARVEESRISQTMRSDVQKGARSPIKLPLSLYRLVYSVNTRKCVDEVMLQRASAGNYSSYGRNGQFEYVAGRSSVGDIILRGEPSKFRPQRIVVEGTVSSRPYGIESAEILTITNQTLTLISTSEYKQVKPSSSLKPIKTWKYQVVSPNSKKNARSWVLYEGQGSAESPLPFETVLTGYRISPEVSKTFAETAAKLIEEAADKIVSTVVLAPSGANIGGTSTGKAAGLLNRASKYIASARKQEIVSVFQSLMSQQGEKGGILKSIVPDVFVQAGSAASVKVVFDAIKSNKISSERGTYLAFQVGNTLQAPAAVKEIWPIVKDFSLENHPILASTSLLTTSRLAYRLCVKDGFKNFSVPLPVVGSQDCSSEFVKSDMLPFFKNLLESSSKEFARELAVRSIGNLGFKEAVEILAPIINGEKERSPEVRMAAVESIGAEKLEHAAREKALEVLIARIAATGEDPAVRQAAVGSVISWLPGQDIYSLLADLTWKEPSRNMRHFVAQVLYQISRIDAPHLRSQAKMATHAFQEVEPSIHNYRSSNVFLGSRYKHEMQLGSSGALGYVEVSPEGGVPRLVFGKARLEQGSYRVRVVEATVATKSIEGILEKVFENFRTSVPASSNVHNPTHKKMQRLMEDAEQELGRKIVAAATGPISSVNIKILENMQFFAPLNSFVLKKVFAPEGAQQHIGGSKKISATFFSNPLPITTFMGSDVAPIVSMFELPILQKAEGQAEVKVQGVSQPTYQDLVKAKRIEIDFNIDYRLVITVKSSLKALVPFTNKTISAGVDNEKSIHLPVKGQIVITRKTENSMPLTSVNATLQIKPGQQQVPVLYSHNLPFLKKRSLFAKPSEQPEVRVIAMSHDNQLIHKRNVQMGEQALGISGTYKYEGDVRPMQAGDFILCIQRPATCTQLFTSRVTRAYRSQFIVSPGSSQAKAIRLSLSNQRSLFQFPAPQNRKVDLAFTASVSSLPSLESSTPLRYYGAVFRYGSRDESQSTNTEYQVSVFRGPTQSDSQSRVVCSELTVQSPETDTLSSLKQALQGSPKATINGKVTYGSVCQSGEQIAKINGRAEVSAKRSEELKREINESPAALTDDPTVTFPIHAVYDKLNADVTYESNKVPASVINGTQRLYDLVQGAYFPYVKNNYLVSNQPNKIEIDLQRALTSPHYSAAIVMPHQTMHVSNIAIPRVFDAIEPISGVSVRPGTYVSELLRRAAASRCVIKPEGQVQTFDQAEYSAELTPCWTVAATDRSSSQSYKLYVRNANSQMNFRFHSTSEDVVVEGQKVLVNGSPVKVSEQKVVSAGPVRISEKAGGVVVVKYPGQFTALVSSERVTIDPSSSQSGKMSGLCGSFSGRQSTNLRGPEGCVYPTSEKGKLFASAWTISQGEGCEASQLEKEKRPLESYRAKCPRA